MSVRPIVCSLAFAMLAATGCAYGEVRQVVRAQFASELDCPEVFIVKRDAWYQYDSPNQFKVSGCGVMRSYTCPVDEGRVSYDKPACTWVEGDADAPKMKKRDAEGNVIEESEDVEGEPPADDAADDMPADEPAEPLDDADDDDAADDKADDDLGADSETSGGTSSTVKSNGKKTAASGQASGAVQVSPGVKIGTTKKK